MNDCGIIIDRNKKPENWSYDDYIYWYYHNHIYFYNNKYERALPVPLRRWVNWLQTLEGRELKSLISYLRKETKEKYIVREWPREGIPYIVTVIGPQLNIRCKNGKNVQNSLKALVEQLDGQRSKDLHSFLAYIIPEIKNRAGFPKELLDMIQRFHSKPPLKNLRLLNYRTRLNPQNPQWDRLDERLHFYWQSALAAGRSAVKNHFIKEVVIIHRQIDRAIAEIEVRRETRQAMYFNKLVNQLRLMAVDPGTAMHSYIKRLNPLWFHHVARNPLVRLQYPVFSWIFRKL